MDNILTPKNIYSRSATTAKVCCLCAEESNRVSRIFSVAGKSRGICEKIKIFTGVEILETADGSSDAICRKCDRFVESVINFKKIFQENQHKLLHTHAVKRVISPATKRKYNRLEQYKIFKKSVILLRCAKIVSTAEANFFPYTIGSISDG